MPARVPGGARALRYVRRGGASLDARRAHTAAVRREWSGVSGAVLEGIVSGAGFAGAGGLTVADAWALLSRLGAAVVSRARAHPRGEGGYGRHLPRAMLALEVRAYEDVHLTAYANAYANARAVLVLEVEGSSISISIPLLEFRDGAVSGPLLTSSWIGGQGRAMWCDVM